MKYTLHITHRPRLMGLGCVLLLFIGPALFGRLGCHLFCGSFGIKNTAYLFTALTVVWILSSGCRSIESFAHKRGLNRKEV